MLHALNGLFIASSSKAFNHHHHHHKSIAFEIAQRVHFCKMVSDSISAVKCLKVKKLSPAAIKPTRGSEKAAGYDLYAAHDAVIHARGKSLIKTDLAIQIPSGFYGRVAARSGLAWKHSLDVGAGVIDEDYRGNIGVILFNHSDQPFNINRGDRIAQLILEKIITPEVVEVEELDQTERDADGFGSTGVGVLSSPNKKN